MQAAADSKDMNGVVQTNGLATLNVAQPQSPRSIGRRLLLHFEITPISDKQLYVDSVRADFPDEVLDTRPGLDADKLFSLKPITDNQLNLGNSFRNTFDLPEVQFDWRHPFSQQSLLFFRGGKQSIKVSAFVTEGVGKTPHPLEKTVEIEFLPSPSGLIFGGFAGSLLLVLFERIFRLSQRLNRPDWPRCSDGSIDWPRVRRAGSAWLFSEGPSGFVQILLGGLSVLLFLTLVSLGQGKDLPVNIKVDGFVSALGVGLFMHFLVVSLYKKLVPADPESSVRIAPGLPALASANVVHANTLEVIPPPAGELVAGLAGGDGHREK